MPAPPCSPAGAVLECAGANELRCDERGEIVSTTCEHVCVEPAGCLRCEPSSIACADDRTLVECSADGAAASERACGPSERCVGARCADLCAEARARADYLGCEYWGSPLPNPLLPPEGFSFAVAIANGHAFEANVEISSGGSSVATAVVPGGETSVIPLPWIEALSRRSDRTAIVPNGAYRIVSDVPVTVTQWNPLEYRSTDADRARGEWRCASETNDASLLLPVHALGTSHLAVSFAPLAFERAGVEPYGAELAARGNVVVVATEPGTTNVSITASAPLEGLEGEARIEPGETRSYTLAQGDALSLLVAEPRDEAECEPVGRRRQCSGAPLDPTGTSIDSDRPVAVFSGHECANVPFDRRACDHLEEQLLPVGALGRSYLFAPHYPFDRDAGVNLVRVISAAAGNTIRFEPALHAEVTLDAGAWVELMTSEPLRITGSGKLSIAAYSVGGEFDLTGPPAAGDPDLVLVAPEEQWQSSYLVLVPGSYTSAFATLIAPEGATVSVDGAALSEATAFGAYRVFHATFDAAAAVHRIEASAPVAATLHGYAPWTSYMHLGGLRVAQIPE
jgi:hypothetical protein